MSRAHVQSLLLLLLAAAGCRKTATEPVASQGPPPAVLVATYPVARSTGVPYDTDIWGEFDVPLDPATVNAQSVFLKLDGQRIASTISYEGATKRAKVRPTVTLALQRTYTVEFTPAVHTAEGEPLPPGVFFQFTTNSLRRLVYDYPVGGILDGPVATLGWGGTQGPAGELFYEVYAGEDSLVVERRAMPYLQRAVFTRYLTSTRWRPGSRVYWAITSENILTHERMDGPVQSFEVLPASVPVETVTLFPRDNGSSQLRFPTTQYCTRATLPCGPSYNGAIRWSYASMPPNVRVVSATITLTAFNEGVTGGPNSYVSLTQNDWQACSIGVPGPPYEELNGLLARGTVRTPSLLDFTSDRLAAFVEAQVRQRTLITGVVVRTPFDLQYHSLGATNQDQVPRMVVSFQRMPAPDPPSAGARPQ